MGKSVIIFMMLAIIISLVALLFIVVSNFATRNKGNEEKGADKNAGGKKSAKNSDKNKKS